MLLLIDLRWSWFLTGHFTKIEMALFIGSLINQPLKITKESDYCYLPDASFECKMHIVEIEFWLATAKESNLPVSGPTREQTYDMPALDVSAY